MQRVHEKKLADSLTSAALIYGAPQQFNAFVQRRWRLLATARCRGNCGQLDHHKKK